MAPVVFMSMALFLYITHTVGPLSATDSSSLRYEPCSHMKTHVKENGTFTIQCWCMLRNILCKNLNSIPNFHDSVKREKWRGIYLPKQNISEIPMAFADLRVKTIILNMNPIGNRINPNAFTGLEDELEEIQMGKCQIGILPPNVIDGLFQLRVLHLWDNNIKNIPSLFFKDSRKIQEISLWGNNIQMIHRDTFAGLWQLKRLDLNANMISDLPQDAFRHLINLEILKLSCNSVKSLQSDTFKHMPNLKVLDLSYNGLHSIYPKAFDKLTKLLMLDLQHNEIEYFTWQPFKGLYNLTALYLNNNKLWKRLVPIFFNHLHSLQTLNLANNNIDSFDDYTLKNSMNLKELILDYNKLTSLRRCIFSKKVKIEVLSLIGNPIQCTCKLRWLSYPYERSGISRVWGTCAYSSIPDILPVADEYNYIQLNCPHKQSDCAA